LQRLGAHDHCHDLGLELGNSKQVTLSPPSVHSGSVPVSIASIVEIAADRHDYLSEVNRHATTG